MSELHVLLVHTWPEPGARHWQHWLAPKLRRSGINVDSLGFSEHEKPVLTEWLRVLRMRLAAAPPTSELVVLAYSLGSILWLHHATSIAGRARRADRVLLVAAPAPGAIEPEWTGFSPVPLDARGVRRAAGTTRMVVGEDDELCSALEAKLAAENLGIDLDVVPGGLHLDGEAGYEEWPAMLEWITDSTTPLTAR